MPASRLLIDLSRLALVVSITLLGRPVAGEPNASRSHADEVQAYAAVMAMAQTASDRCSEILVSNNAMIDNAPEFFHVKPDDKQAYLLTVGIEMKRLAAAIDGAPSLKAWCDAAYRAYGPDGDVIKGLLSR